MRERAGMGEASATLRTVSRRRGWIVLVALVPFWLPYLPHFMIEDRVPTGFFQVDLPTYVAHGRAIFEQGNGLAYPNPYDPGRERPAIYFYTYLWLLGFGVAVLGLDPGLWFLATGVVGGLLFAWLTLRLVDAIVGPSRFWIPLFLMTMWGGGLLAVAAASLAIMRGEPFGRAWLAFDPADGFWFMGWGRNALFPTEAVYHALSAGILLALVRGRMNLAVGLSGLAAITHPFTGAQWLAILTAITSLEFLGTRRSAGSSGRWAALGRLATVLVFNAAFAAYTFGFLESFASHRELRRDWSREWGLSGETILLAYCPVLLLAAIRTWTDRTARGWPEFRLWVVFLISFLLANHDIFLEARQPLHFTRGYVWIPLWLIALPLVERYFNWLTNHLRPRLASWVVLATVVVASLDDAIFLTFVLTDRPPWLYTLAPEERAILRLAEKQQLRGVVLSNDWTLSALTPTYSALTPYCGITINTPRVHERLARLETWRRNGTFPEPLPGDAQIQYLLINPSPEIRSEGLDHPVDFVEWELIAEAGEVRLYRRRESGERRGSGEPGDR